MDTFRTKGTIDAALYASIQKNIYNSIYKIMGGSDALKARDFINYMPAYVLASGGSKLSKQALHDINGAISAQLHSYINYEQTKPENIGQSALLLAAAKATDINSLPLPTGINTTFSNPSNHESYYPIDSLSLNHSHNKTLPMPSSLSNKNLNQQNLYNFLPTPKLSIANESQSTPIIVLAAAAINAARSWIFRKPKSEKNTKTTSNTKKSSSKDRGGRSWILSKLYLLI